MSQRHQEITVTRDDKITTVAKRQAGSSAGNGGPMGAGRVVEKPANFIVGLKRLLSHLRPERATILFAMLLAAIGVALNVVGPKIIGRATDVIFSGVVGKNLPAGVAKDTLIAKLRAEGKGTLADMLATMDVTPGVGIDFTRLGHILLIGIGVYLIAALFILIQGQLINGVLQRSMYRLRKEVSEKLDRLPLSYFDQQPRGELLSRVTNDIDNVSTSLQQTLTQLLTSLLTLVGVLVMMLQTSSLLTGIALVAIPVSMALVAVIGKQSQKRFAAMWKATGDLNSHIEESYSGHSLVKVFGRQKESIATFKARNSELFQHSFGAQFLSSLIMPIMFFVGNLSFVFIALVGGLRLAHGQMSLGDVQAFIQYNRMFTQPLTQVASMSNVLQSGVASAERVFAVLDADEQSPETTGVLETTNGRVIFDHVDFSYTDEPLITDLSLAVEPGQTVAIVGPTGAGKTTLVNLLMRFYEIQDGVITLDGTDIQTVPRSDLRARIGMVLQDTWLFSGTIRDNIAYGRPDATEEEILEAARATYVDRFVHSLPEGYDTLIDEEASNISAGEKQLITIARAFLKDPALLILDEATSSVDTRTEVLVQKAMNALRADRTSFVIAHRLSTIRDADVIIVMENGHIVEKGSHDELLSIKGAYYELYQSQFSSAVQTS